jgi:hypothetical protein
MEELISRKAAIKMIEEDLPDVVYYRKEDAIACLNCLPTEGTAEEAKDYLRRIVELAEEKDALIKNYAGCMQEYARRIFEELEANFVSKGKLMLVACETYEALKKIYTEGKGN